MHDAETLEVETRLVDADHSPMRSSMTVASVPSCGALGGAARAAVAAATVSVMVRIVCIALCCSSDTNRGSTSSSDIVGLVLGVVVLVLIVIVIVVVGIQVLGVLVEVLLGWSIDIEASTLSLGRSLEQIAIERRCIVR